MYILEVYIENPIYEVNMAYSYYYEEAVSLNVRVIVPFGNGNKEIVGLVSKVYLHTDEDLSKLKKLIRVIETQSLLNDELLKLAKYMEETNVAPYMACVQALLPTFLKPKGTTYGGKMLKYIKTHTFDADALPIKQKEAYLYLLKHQTMLYSEFRSMYANVAKSLLDKGACELYEVESKASFDKNYIQEVQNALNDEQAICVNRLNQVNAYKPFLLYGVTGSGKTEVYLQSAQNVINAGKDVIILVPEIGLTPQMIRRVKARFKNQIAIYHSRLSPQEKYEQYMLIKEGQVKIVVGTRSAIFMPFTNLGLIILDEEHDRSYKQDISPRYHARDIGIFRAKYHNCPILLASATPSFESYARSSKKVYELLELTKRISTSMPICHLVDMKKELKQGNYSLISTPLKNAIDQAISANEQVILLFNRRGYAPNLSCKKCKEVLKCPHCDISLSYHKNDNTLKCHYCDYSKPYVEECPNCQSHSLVVNGYGIQKLEEEINTYLHKYRLIRMDRDTTSKKNAHETLIGAFERHEADILIGTQMIAKGLDFENVSVVGILNADQGLNRGDFRACEETYQLISQACGRSGRAFKQGEVYIQSFDPNHYALNFASKHQYHNFFMQEMAYRHLGNYPPYCYLSSVICINNQASKASLVIRDISEYLKSKNLNIKIYGPSELVRVQDNYRFRILVKTKDEQLLKELMNEIISEFKMKQKVSVKIVIDINPTTL